MKNKWFYRFQQFLIFIAHLVLLKWMLWCLQETGNMEVNTVFAHFAGMSVYGASLIIGTAKWAMYHHKKDLRNGQMAN